MKVAIVGAGIGGLAAALALARTGHAVTVFERAEVLVPVGAGLQLSPNALDVLDRLGLSERLEASGVAADAVTLRRGSSGRAIARVPVGSEDGRGYLSLLRADLQDALLAGLHDEPRIELRLGHALAVIEPVAGWTLRFAEGQVAAGYDLLVAADGVHSAVATMRGHPAPADSGSSAIRLRVPKPATPGIEAWLGARRHAVSYPVASGRETNLVLIVPTQRSEESPARLFRGWDRRLIGLIEDATPLGAWPLRTRSPHWHEPGIAYLGDAAHAMLPFAAQGAAMAIEDAWVLAVALARETEPATGLAAYAAMRAPRVERVLRRVAFHRMVYHLPVPLSFGRDVVLAGTPAKRLKDQLAWLYDWRAPPVDFSPG